VERSRPLTFYKKALKWSRINREVRKVYKIKGGLLGKFSKGIKDKRPVYLVLPGCMMY
jgi:hypothetical protein